MGDWHQAYEKTRRPLVLTVKDKAEAVKGVRRGLIRAKKDIGRPVDKFLTLSKKTRPLAGDANRRAAFRGGHAGMLAGIPGRCPHECGHGRPEACFTAAR